MPLLEQSEPSNVTLLRPPPTEEAPVEFAHENLSSLTRLGRSFERGQLVRESGKIASEIRTEGMSQDRVVRLDTVRKRIDELGGDGPGFVGFLGAAGEVVGQMEASIADPRMATTTAAGAATFGTIGALAGPAAAPSAGVGAAVGAVSHLAMDAFEVESGLSYIDQLEAGVSPDVAYWTSFGVGAANAALEMTGLKFVAAPFKKLLVKEAAKDPRVIAAVTRAAGAYGGAVAGETATEVLQEAVSIAAEEIGKAFEGKEATSLPELTDQMVEIMVKTVSAMSVLAVPGAGASLIADRRRSRAAAANKEKLDAFKEKVDELPKETAAETTQSALLQADLQEVYIPAQELVNAAALLDDPTQLYQTLGADGAFVSAVEDAATLGGDIRLDSRRFTSLLTSELWPNLADHIRMDPDGMTAAEAKEVDAQLQSQVEEASTSAQEEEIVISSMVEDSATIRAVADDLVASGQMSRALANNLVQRRLKDKDAFSFKDIKTGVVGTLRFEGDDLHVDIVETTEGANTVGLAGMRRLGEALAVKFPQAKRLVGNRISGARKQAGVSGETATISLDLFRKGTTLAEAEMGLQALFRTAKDAGLTDKQYEAYLVAIQKAADSRNAAAEQRRLKAESAENKAEIKRLREELEVTAREHLSSLPVYQALQGIGRERLDRDALAAVIGAAQLENLPKQQGRTIYTAKGEQGIDPEAYAELYGFDGADIMAFAMMDVKPFEAAVAAETDRLFTERYAGVSQRQKELDEQIEALHNDTQAQVLTLELNALREAKDKGRLKLAQVKTAAKDRLRDYKLKDITAKKFLQNERRAAKRAAQLLRKGDRPAAAKAKFEQLVNFLMAQEAYKVRDKTRSQHKYFKKFTKKEKSRAPLPIDYLGIIRTMLGVVDLKRTQTLKQVVLEKQAADGVILSIPAKVLENNGKTHYLDLSLRDWENLYEGVKAVEQQGLNENRFLREAERHTREEVAGKVIANVQANLKSRAGEVVETNWEQFKDFGRGLRLTLFNTDTLLREIDGFASLGDAYNAIKRPYDQAISRGYMPGQKGYTARLKKESDRLLRLFSVFTKKELVNMKKRVAVPGVKTRMSHQRVLSVLLNSGNLENRLALTESGQFTEADIEAIHAFASEKDWKFAQSVWDYLDEFWPEVKDTIKRRQNLEGERVEATAIDTPHGTFRGGYYPLQYDARESVLPSTLAHSGDVQKMIEEMRFGSFTVSHTKNGHTRERQGSGGRAVRLDLFVLNAHVDQVVYDLEVGDAVIDIYKVLHHRGVRRAFQDQGQTHTWDKLDLWFADIVMGEMHYGEAIEKAFRHLRTGFVVSKMGFNIMTMAMQPLGLLQSMPLLGKMNVLQSVMQTLMNPKSFRFVDAQSTFMQQRQATFNREIMEAQGMLKSNLVRRITPGNSAQAIAGLAFYGLIKLQRVVDVATWIAGKRQGMKMFGNEAKAIEHADRMVARTQASGIFGERTQFERGTAGKKVKQSELVRAFVPLISYFMAKTNVAYERVRKTNFKNPLQIIDLTVDLTLMYLVEAILVAMLREGWPEDEDDVPWFVFSQLMKSMPAGIPGLRDLISEAEGFRGGGIIPSTLGEAARVMQQVNQGELDKAAVKSAARLGGTLFGVPGTSQMIRTGDAIYQSQQGEDIEALEFMLGPRWKD